MHVCVSHDPREDNVKPDQHRRSNPNKRLSFSHDGILISQESKLGFSLSMLAVTSCPPFISCPTPPPHFTSRSAAEGNKEKRERMDRSTLCTYTPQGELCFDELLPQTSHGAEAPGELLSFKLSFQCGSSSPFFEISCRLLLMDYLHICM